MATATTKKTTTATTTTSTTEKPETDSRIAEQANEIAELKAQIALLMKAQKASTQTTTVESTPKRRKTLLL